MNDDQRRKRIKKLASKTIYVKFKPISNVYELRWPCMTYKQFANINASTGAVIEFACTTEVGKPVTRQDNYLEKIDRRIRYLLFRVKDKTPLVGIDKHKLITN